MGVVCDAFRRASALQQNNIAACNKATCDATRRDAKCCGPARPEQLRTAVGVCRRLFVAAAAAVGALREQPYPFPSFGLSEAVIRIFSYHMSLSGSKVAVDALLETSAKRMLVLSCLLGGGRAKPDAAVPAAATDSGARAQSDASQLCAARCSRARSARPPRHPWLHLPVRPTHGHSFACCPFGARMELCCTVSARRLPSAPSHAAAPRRAAPE